MVVHFDPLEVSTPHIFYACLGGFVVLFGMVSLFIREKLYIGEALLAFLFGVIIGPYGANILNPHSWGGASKEVTDQITIEVTRVVLAIGVFAIGVELPKAYMRRHWKSLLFLLGPVMTWGWFVSAGLIYAFIPGLSFLSCLTVAACLTPTDPILAAAVVGGKWADKHVPSHLRHLLAAESGCNDGAAFPFLFISLNLLLYPNVGLAIRDWFLLLWLYQIILGVLIGSAIGFGFRHLMKFGQRRNLIDRQSYVAQYISLALLTIGITTLLGSDDLLACFCCGAAFAWDGFFNQQTEESVFSSVIDLLFNVTAFVYVGAWTPFGGFEGVNTPLKPWRLLIIAILVLILRRLPIIVALHRWIPDIKNPREAIFSGHFGPIGVGAVFISTLAVQVIRTDHHPKTHQIQLLEQTIQPIVAFMVVCSVAIHGLSIPSFSLGRRVRTVSRTWSRHALAPDWTNQAKLIHRGADIVINRDSDMEQGKLPGRKGIESETLTLNASEKDKKIGDDDAVTDGEQGNVETINEWEELTRTVVERQRGPTDDVIVEITPKAPPTVPGMTARIRHSLHLLDRLRKSAEYLEDHVRQNVENQIMAIEGHIKAQSSSETRKDEHSQLVIGDDDDDDDDDGWTSDNEPSFTAETKSRRRSQKGKSTSKSHGHIHFMHHHHHHQYSHRGRSSSRRNSTSKSVHDVSTPSPFQDPIHENIETVTHHSRRNVASFSSSSSSTAISRTPSTLLQTPEHERPSPSSSFLQNLRPSTADGLAFPQSVHCKTTARPGTSGSPYGRRVEHLRTLHSSPATRDSSPSRSIRFKDESRSGMGTGGRTPPRPQPEKSNGGGGGGSGTGGFPRSLTK